MKYPQLVSTKAVNEISDWLIKRLEDLDIEQPSVYSRLLLSLLHTPFKINAIDLLEDLKQPHRLLNKNNEELKRLAAVESLIEVSAQENKSSIVNLVDELHSKLRKIENNCEEVANLKMSSNSSSPVSASSSKFYKNLKKIKRNHHGAESATKNYYLAFPALNGTNKKSTATITAATAATSSSNEPLFKDVEAAAMISKETNNNNNLLSWSNLMSSKKENPSLSSQLVDSDLNNRNVKTPRKRQRQQRYGNNNRVQKTDVQFTTKSFAKYDNNNATTFSPKKMQMVKNSNNNNNKKHQRNQYDSSKNIKVSGGNRNNNFSNTHNNNAPKMDLASSTTTANTTSSTGSAPWDMDFKGHWEMDRDLISEFIQQQQQHKQNNNNINKNNFGSNTNIIQNHLHAENLKVVNSVMMLMKQQQQHDENEKMMAEKAIIEEDDVMLMKCLPTKLIDESLVDDPYNNMIMKARKPCNNKEAHSISSLKSKFDDENVKAIWGDCGGSHNNNNDPFKPLTQKTYFESDGIFANSNNNNGGGGSASLASSFSSEKNSLSLFNFNEQQTHHFEVNVSSYCTENYQQQFPYKSINQNVDYDCNNNHHNSNNNNNNNYNSMVNYGGRGANISKNSSFAAASPRQSDQLMKSDFIKSGTNLLTSIWSDTGDFTSDAESLILKEVADPSDDVDGTYLNSIGAEMKQQQQWQNNNATQDDEEVTLINHSEKSAFKKFKPSLINSTIIRANYHPLNTGGYVDRSNTGSSSNSSSNDDSDNYLTSEKTHFCPIIRDGHTFVIDNSWDEIEWERSSEGDLMYNNKKYRIWDSGYNNSSNHIIINKNRSATTDDSEIDLSEMENDASEFTIKYMVMEDNDKGCQTDESVFNINRNNRSFLEISEEYCKRKIYDEYFKSMSDSVISHGNKWRYLNSGDDSNDYSFFSVNRVKSDNNNNNNNCLKVNNLSTQNFHDLLLSSNSSSSSICTITSSYEASSAVDPFESWRSIKVDDNKMIDPSVYGNINNNNNNNIQKQQPCMHRLWEQCLVCARNNEDPYADKPSQPANRLLKDELQLDGDEIMNVIQNLYITGDYCDEDEEKEDDCDEFHDMNHVYMNMIMDDSMDDCTLEDESKFYEPSIDAKNQKNLASNIIDLHHHHHHHHKDLLNLESYDEITLTKMQWQWSKMQEKDINNYEKYLKLLNWIKTSLVKNNNAADTNNNDCQNLNEVHLTRNRKRRHSTCQNLLEKKRYHSHDEGFTYHLNVDNNNTSSQTPSFHEDNNLFFDAAKMLNVNVEKILLITDPCLDQHHQALINATALENYYKDQQQQQQQAIAGGTNYYRNIMQQQHALIKQLDLSRPLTR